MDQYIIPKEISSEMKFAKNFYLFDLVFIVGALGIAWLLSACVYSKLVFLYYIFVFLGAVFLAMKSKHNPEKRNFQTIYYAIKKDKTVYKRI